VIDGEKSEDLERRELSIPRIDKTFVNNNAVNIKTFMLSLFYGNMSSCRLLG
jgi:hypothetical protein